MPDDHRRARFTADLDKCVEALDEFYAPLDVMPWLTAPHKLLNGARAIDLLGTDRSHEVFAVIDQMRSGAYV